MRKRSTKAILLGAAVGALGSFLPSFSAQAATFTWNAASGNWNTNANWLPNTGNPNSNSDIAIFGTTGTGVTVNTARSVGSIIFNINANFAVSGSSALTLNTGISAASSGTGRTYTISAPLSLSNNVTLDVAGSNTLTISSVITDSSTFGLTKNNSGLLILGNANTYHGATIINAGTLQLSGGINRLPTATGVSISGGTLDLNDNNQTIASLSGSAGTVDLGLATLTFGDSSNTSFSGVIVGTGNIVKQGSGVSTFGGANTYTGITTVVGGALVVTTLANGGTNSGIGASTNAASKLVLDGGTLRYTGAGVSTDRLFTFSNNGGTLDSSGTGALQFTNSGALGLGGDDHAAHVLTLTGSDANGSSLAALIADPAHDATYVVKSGTGKWILGNSGSNYAGTTTIQGGTLEIGAIALGGATSPIGNSSNANTNLILDGGTLRYTGGSGTTDRLYSVGTASGAIDASGTSGSLNFSNTGSIGFNGENGSRILTLTGSNTGSNTMNVIVRDQGAGSLTSLSKSGAGRWLVNSANTYSGVTTISGGTLEAGVLANGGANSSIGKSTNAAGNLVLNGGTLRYTGTGVSIDRNYTLGANGGGIDASGSAGTLAISGNMAASAVGGSQTFTLYGSNTNGNTLSGQIVNGTSGNVTSLTKDGAGKWLLSNANNTYSGITTISNGTLALGGGTINNIVNSPTINVRNSTSNLDVTASGLTLSTTVDQTLSGNGTVYGAVTASGAHNTTIAPGNSPGKLTFANAGDLTLSPTSTTVEMEIGGDGVGGIGVAGTNYDQIVISSASSKALNINGAKLKLLPSAGIVTGQAYTLVATSGAGATVNFSTVFKNLDNTPMADNGTYSQGPVTFNIDYNSAFVKVTFTTVPEPASMSLLLLGAPALLKRRRRR